MVVVVVVEGVIPNPVVGAITMIAIGILLNILGPRYLLSDAFRARD